MRSPSHKTDSLTEHLPPIAQQQGDFSLSALQHSRATNVPEHRHLAEDGSLKLSTHFHKVVAPTTASAPLFSYVYECVAPLDVDVTNAAKAVRGSFHLADHTLDGFGVYENFVSFGVVSGAAAFIYSENGEKPMFVNKPDEVNEKKPYVEKITDNWYYVCR